MGDTEDRPEANSTMMNWGRFRGMQGGARKYLETLNPVEARPQAQKADRFAAEFHLAGLPGAPTPREG